MRRAGAVASAALLFSAVVAGPAQASTSSDTGWQPVGPTVPYDVPGCGTTLTVSDKVNEVEYRTRDDGRGNSRTDYRGRYVVKVAAPDGRKVVLDSSGEYTEFVAANGDSYVPIQAPGAIFALDDAEAAVFRAAGLPRNFYFTKGRLDLVTRDGQESVTRKPKDAVSICKLLR